MEHSLGQILSYVLGKRLFPEADWKSARMEGSDNVQPPQFPFLDKEKHSSTCKVVKQPEDLMVISRQVQNILCRKVALHQIKSLERT